MAVEVVALSVRDLAIIAQKVEKKEYIISPSRLDHETDMIRRMKRRLMLKAKRIVLHSGMKNR
jgi:hypothetical protein